MTKLTWVTALIRLVTELRSSRRSIVTELQALTDAVDRLTFLVATDLTTRGIPTQGVTTALLSSSRFLRADLTPSPTADADLAAENLAGLTVDDASLAQLEALDAAERAAGRQLSEEERDDLLDAWVADVQESEIRTGRPTGPGPAPTAPRRASTRGLSVPYIP